jgi:DNA-directed RNA polymerase specialized sigma subunit
MVYVEELSQRQIAERYGISPASGFRRVRDAVERLRTALVTARVRSRI